MKNTKPCPQINPENKDIDNMPFAPPAVLSFCSNQVFRCAFYQAKANEWKPPTQDQIDNIEGIITAFHDNYVSGTKRSTGILMDHCKALGLQCCRAKVDPNPDNPLGDSYILIYTIKGKTDYNGPFLQLREQNASNVVIVSPHDGTDNTSQDTKISFKKSRAIAMVSNGHKKWSKEADFSKTRNNLGNYALRKLAEYFHKLVILNIHGMIYTDFVLVRSRYLPLKDIFVKVFEENTGITRVQEFNAYYDIDTIPTPYQLKTEIPIKVHLSQAGLLGKIVREIEKNAWAWPVQEQEVKQEIEVVDTTASVVSDVDPSDVVDTECSCDDVN
jgi:hypothetical protein